MSALPSLGFGVALTRPLLADLITSRASGGNDLDWSSLVAGPRLAAGLLPFTGTKEYPRDTGFGSAVGEDDEETARPVPDGAIKHVKNF